MKASYSAFISSTHCSYMKYVRASNHTHALLAKFFSGAKCLHGKLFNSPGRDPTSQNSPRRVTRLRHINTSPGNAYFFIEGELPGKACNSVNRVTRFHINRPLVGPSLEFNFIT